MPITDDHEIQTKLKVLKTELDRNEDLMCQAAISYENLVAAKETLSAAIADLKKKRMEARRQTAD